MRGWGAEIGVEKVGFAPACPPPALRQPHDRSVDQMTGVSGRWVQGLGSTEGFEVQGVGLWVEG